jgi:D-sedoheptulose 7-phosphate isomerase
MEEIEFTVENYIKSYQALTKKVSTQEINFAINLVKEKINSRNKIYICGNGGSAHTASHFITDWSKMYHLATNKKIEAYALTDNIGLITAFANDISFKEIFSGQLKSVLSEGDLLIGISGSGNSENIIKALEYANSINATTLAILGYDGGRAIKVSNHNVLVKSFDMQLVEDFHLQIGHMIMKSICKTTIKE